MPADDGLRLHDDQDVPPTRPETAQSAPEEPLEGVQRRTRSLALQDRDLLSKGKDFESRVAATSEENADGGEDGESEFEHELPL
ncbi:MAG TPA: hypothetical protein PKJ41_01535 [Bryobacteraceae bacterium]|nr:hypothetical protein [Bryobacteraceae bacterium]